MIPFACCAISTSPPDVLGRWRGAPNVADKSQQLVASGLSANYSSHSVPRHTMTKRLVLLGGGHAHIQVRGNGTHFKELKLHHLGCMQVVRQLKAADHEGVELVLVSDAPTAYYSGMIPGSVAVGGIKGCLIWRWHCLVWRRLRIRLSSAGA